MPQLPRFAVAALALALLLPQNVRAAPATLEWSDLVPTGSQAALTLRDGRAASGVVEHGQIAPQSVPISPAPSDGAEGGDALGAIDSLRGLQPQGASIRPDLDGKEVRIAGFITPISFEGNELSEFLLVPYVGACIHVPPPPANQIVFVSGVKGYEATDLFGMFDPVWVTGTLRAVPLATDLAEVGYQMEGAKVEAYE